MWVNRVRAMGRWACVRAVVASLLLLAFSSPAFGQASGEFTPKERRALSAGELVTRPAERRAGALELIGGSAWQVIDAPPEVVFRALLDTPHYPRMMPTVQEAHLVAGAGSEGRTVFMRQGAGPIDVSYFLRVQVDRARRDITFRVDPRRPHDLRAAWGSYSVRAYPGGRTLLAYGIMADLGRGMLRVLVRETVHEWMLKVPWSVKRFVEGSGRWVYDYEPPSERVTASSLSGPDAAVSAAR